MTRPPTRAASAHYKQKVRNPGDRQEYAACDRGESEMLGGLPAVALFVLSPEDREARPDQQANCRTQVRSNRPSKRKIHLPTFPTLQSTRLLNRGGGVLFQTSPRTCRLHRLLRLP